MSASAVPFPVRPLKPTLRVLLAVLVLSTVLASSSAQGQRPGDILWSTPLEVTVGGTHSRPALGPDGTVYVMVEDLFAVGPDGSLQWRAPVNSLSVSTVAVVAGRVHISADYGPEKFVIAYDPEDGAEVWRTEVDAATSAFYGPNVGPDGHLFGVVGVIGSGAGAFSIDPADGTLRWNVEDFSDEGVNVKARDVPFGSDRFFISDRGVPCSPFGWGTAALSYDGDLLWCVPGLVQLRPDVGPSDVVYGVGFNALTKFSPDGDVLWQFPFPPPVLPLQPPTVGPDGTVYVPENNELWAFEPDGSVRYHIESGLGPARGRVTVSPDGSVLLFPVGGTTREVIALDAAEGFVLWRTALPYPPDGPFTFSADGTVAYVARWGGTDAPSELVAFYVGGSGVSTDREPSTGALRTSALSAAFPNPFRASARLTMKLAEAQAVTAMAYDALGRRVAVLHDGPLAAGDHTITFEGAGLPGGLYLVRVTGTTFSATRHVALVR